jgi:hypothetical protein
MQDMADALSASSLLLAILAVLFGAWNGEVVAAIRIELEDLRSNRRPQRQKIAAALFPKALPIMVGAWLTVLVFAQRTLALVGAALHCVCSSCSYNDVEAAFVLTQAFVLVLAISVTIQAVRLIVKLLKSYGPDK